MRMPKEHTRRGRPPPHLIDPQLLYPAGCSKERAVKYFLLALLKLLQHNLAQHTLSRTYEVHFTMDNVILLCKSN
ncbi:hypothetical protein PC121_g14435 [Phytophthora cactorum]|nr:hypothetical protein PC121_g14435 [Phytophthora cactorum]